MATNTLEMHKLQRVTYIKTMKCLIEGIASPFVSFHILFVQKQNKTNLGADNLKKSNQTSLIMWFWVTKWEKGSENAFTRKLVKSMKKVLGPRNIRETSEKVEWAKSGQKWPKVAILPLWQFQNLHRFPSFTDRETSAKHPRRLNDPKIAKNSKNGQIRSFAENTPNQT